MKNDRLNLFFTSLVLSFYLFSTNALFAQSHSQDSTESKSGVRIQKTNWSNSMGCPFGDSVCVLLSEDNQLWIRLVVRFADSTIWNYPPMYFKYTFSNYTSNPASSGYTTKVTPDMIEPTFLENGDAAWMAAFLFKFNLADHCNTQSSFPFKVSYQLVSSNQNNEYLPYPEALYPTLFPPDTFDIDTTGFAPYISITKDICCYDQPYTCSSNPNPPPQKVTNKEEISLTYGQYENQEDFQSTVMAEEKVVLYPNPFSETLTIRPTVAIEWDDTSLMIYDLQGKPILQQERFRLNADGEYLIPTEHWPPGIYFLHFSSKHHSKIVKAVKY